MMKRIVKPAVWIFVLVIYTASFASAAEMVSIASDKVHMRTGPGENYPILWELGLGFPLKVREARGNWLKVEDFEGDIGWVAKKLTEKSPHFIVKKKRVNIRYGPGPKYKIVGKANLGVVLKTLGQDEDWVKVSHENGLSGWIKRDLLWGW